MRLDSSAWRGRSALVTGHTGFSGAWLSLWLAHLGAKVHGYALNPPTEPALFDVSRIGELLASDTRADLADQKALRATFADAAPQVVFHLAAQTLVRQGYRDPLATFATNTIGTAKVLEAARTTESVRAIVAVTTDKVYENREDGRAYREADALGGHDPYSASKAAAEIVAASYRASFLGGAEHPNLATARAGNVLGGGDWASDRLVPDCLRAFAQRIPVQLRFPRSTRPWQHVLDALRGYLLLAQALLSPQGSRFARAWNFGPGRQAEANVAEVANAVAAAWGDGARVEHAPSAANPHEAGLLRLDSTLARDELGWQPCWSLSQALEQTVLWHRAWMRGSDMGRYSLAQIDAHMESVPA